MCGSFPEVVEFDDLLRTLRDRGTEVEPTGVDGDYSYYAVPTSLSKVAVSKGRIWQISLWEYGFAHKG